MAIETKSGKEDDASVPLKTKLAQQQQSYDESYTSATESKSRYIYVLAFFSAIGGFLFGYDTGVVSGAMLLIKREMELDTMWHEAIVSSTIAAAWVFALIAGYLSDRFGRKPVILAASVTFTVGSVVMGFASDKEALLAGRIIVGIGIGLASMVVPLYLAEAARSKERGFLVTLNVMFITGGQAVAAVFGGLLANVPLGWRYMLGIAAIPAVVQFIGFMFMPESPRWLVRHAKHQEARQVLQRVRGLDHHIDDELEAIKASVEESEREVAYRKERGQANHVFVQILQTPAVRRALLLGCLLQMFQQIAGINTVMYYSATIIQMAGFYDTAKAIWLSALVASVNFVCTFIGIWLVDRMGRRRLTLISLFGVVCSLAFLAVGFMVVDSHSYPVTDLNATDSEVFDMCSTALECNECNSIPECGFCFFDDANLGVTQGSCLPFNTTHAVSEYGPCSNISLTTPTKNSYVFAYGWCPSSYGYLTVIGLMTYLFFFAPGMGPMPWTINAEIYPLWARSTCNSIATSTNWFFNFLVSVTFLTMTEILTREGAFMMYCGTAFVGLVLFWWLLPETKGHTLEEMEILFSMPRKCPWPLSCAKSSDPCEKPDTGKSVQYVQIRGLNRDRKLVEDDDDY